MVRGNEDSGGRRMEMYIRRWRGGTKTRRPFAVGGVREIQLQRIARLNL